MKSSTRTGNENNLWKCPINCTCNSLVSTKNNLNLPRNVGLHQFNSKILVFLFDIECACDRVFVWREENLCNSILWILNINFSEASINDTCFFNEQCEANNFQTECRSGRCICRFEMTPVLNRDGNWECKGEFCWRTKCRWFTLRTIDANFCCSIYAVTQGSREPERYVDPAMIGILVGMAIMFIIICVVLRLFSRWVVETK